MDVKKQQALVAAAVACLLTAAGVTSVTGTAHAEEAACYGVNKCKGVGECGSSKGGHACAGKNECAGKGWIKLDKDDCLKIQGGRLTEE